MTRYGIILGKDPPPAPEPVKPIDYFMGVDFSIRFVEVVVGHLERMKTEYSNPYFFKIDFINQNSLDQRDTFEWLIRIQQMYRNKGTLKIRADQRGYQIWSRYFERTDGPSMEMIPVNNTWKALLRELCTFHNISYGISLTNFQMNYSSVKIKDYEDAYNLAISGAAESIRKNYAMTDALMTSTIHAKMSYQ